MKRKTLLLTSIIGFIFIFEKPVISQAKVPYIVHYGDTFWNISIRYSIKLADLINVNSHVENPNMIYPGDKIYIPHISEMNNQVESLYALINAERRKKGLKPLKIDIKLNTAAQVKAEDMRIHQYVAHKSPTYGNPNLMLEAFKIPSTYVQENIGAGLATPEEMFSSWMNSSIHREKLMDENLATIGIGYAEGGLHNYYWTVLMVKE